MADNGSYSYGGHYGGNNMSYGGSTGGGGDGGVTLRRRHVSHHDDGGEASPSKGVFSRASSSSVVQSMDFMFPKVDREFIVQTDRGGMASIIAYVCILIFMIAESSTWLSANASNREHISIDTSLGKRMRVDMNITFPSLACEDLHLDAMDVAGDSQLNVDNTLTKRPLHLDGTPLSNEEIVVQANQHRTDQEKKERILKQDLPDDYCGPCYGANSDDVKCCQTCDEVLNAYKAKKWRSDLVVLHAEQCVREGRDNQEPKLMKKGEGCNLSGFMTVNRVAGNFHIAMGEGVERDGRHIHTFVPEDAPNFNASHIIHQLKFGPSIAEIDAKAASRSTASAYTTIQADPHNPLKGVTKIVTENHGSTGLFQYFIKVVPTTYLETPSTPSGTLESNRYFFTERFRPLLQDEEFFLDESSPARDRKLDEDEKDKDKDTTDDKDKDGKINKKDVQAGHAGGHSNRNHHKIHNSVLPGVFFIYEIYPFAVEISKNKVPFTHLLIRLMATVGGVLTIARWLDTFLYERDRQSQKRMSGVSPSIQRR